MEHIYTCLKYIILWIILFFSFKILIQKKDIIDMALGATILTILVFVVHNIIVSCYQENMINTSGDINMMINNQDNNQDNNQENNQEENNQEENNQEENNQENNQEENNFLNMSQADFDKKLEIQENDYEKNKYKKDAFNVVVEPRKYRGAENLNQIGEKNGLTRDDTLVNQFIYSDFNRLPPSFVKNDYEEGYSFMPPKDWFPIPVYPPICSSSRSCLVQPVYTDDSTMNLKDWKETQRIITDNINTDFIKEVLNNSQ